MFLRQAALPPTFFIAGLGNPGTQYHHTRHNLGFLVIDALLKKRADITPRAVSTPRTECQCQIWSWQRLHLPKLLLIKPQTFMNNSGSAIAGLMRKYKIPVSALVIIYDDVNLPFGNLKIKTQGSSGGHNGIHSIIDQLGSHFTRIKAGIAPEHATAAVAGHARKNYVLGTFNTAEQAALPCYTQTLAKLALVITDQNADAAMNCANGKNFTALTLPQPQ